jgi:hypothetical protein
MMSAGNVESTMSELDGIRSIEISYDSLNSLLSKVTNNPVAEDYFSALLTEAIDKGIPVLVKDSVSDAVRRLTCENGKFVFL